MKANAKLDDKIIQELLQISSLIHIPQNDEEYKNMTDILFKLTRKVGENKDHPLFPAMELLTLSIEHYDNEHFHIDEADGVSILKYFMEEFDLKQKDLQKELGTQGVVSEILNGKRKLNRNQIEKLSERFLVSPAVFF
ncbi:MAG: helix-turn-helix domain-containing protein [Spirochaetia bacterium]|jgi:HTH-type transcriptional regulator/antitoxin HigA|nr:helix-turn-helix domain-containing protein [Spirochaetia bacterium]